MPHGKRKRRGQRPTAQPTKNFWSEVLVASISGVIAGLLTNLISKFLGW